MSASVLSLVMHINQWRQSTKKLSASGSKGPLIWSSAPGPWRGKAAYTNIGSRSRARHTAGLKPNLSLGVDVETRR